MEKTIETKSPKKQKEPSEDVQKWGTFKKSYLAMPQEILRNRKRLHKERSRAIFHGSNEVRIVKVKDIATAFPQKSLRSISRSRPKCIFNLQDHEKITYP